MAEIDTDALIADLIEIWKKNDPADSKSKQVAGQMRRLGRRDVAIQVLAVLTDRPGDMVDQALRDGVEVKLW